MKRVVCRDVTFRYGPTDRVLESLSREFTGPGPIALMGRSGCGKSTLLRLIGGLEEADSGTIELLPEGEEHRVFYTFQDFDAFPWLTAEGNVNFVTNHASSSKGVAAVDILKDVGLEGHEGKYPRQLSGGMRKRLALARAIASDADVLLLDEPFSSLDVLARSEMYDLLFTLCRRFGVFPIVVTHSVEEAVFIGRRVLVCDGPPLRVVDEVVVDLPFPRTVDSRGSSTFEAAYIATQQAFASLNESPSFQG